MCRFNEFFSVSLLNCSFRSEWRVTHALVICARIFVASLWWKLLHSTHSGFSGFSQFGSKRKLISRSEDWNPLRRKYIFRSELGFLNNRATARIRWSMCLNYLFQFCIVVRQVSLLWSYVPHRILFLWDPKRFPVWCYLASEHRRTYFRSSIASLCPGGGVGGWGNSHIKVTGMLV